MTTVNVSEARTHLSRLVREIESGGEAEIVIARKGKPAAKLVPVGKPSLAPRRLGLLAGKYPPMSLEDFNADDEEIAALFNDGPIEPT